jgi:hypothetical protein
MAQTAAAAHRLKANRRLFSQRLSTAEREDLRSRFAREAQLRRLLEDDELLAEERGHLELELMDLSCADRQTDQRGSDRRADRRSPAGHPAPADPREGRVLGACSVEVDGLGSPAPRSSPIGGVFGISGASSEAMSVSFSRRRSSRSRRACGQEMDRRSL